MHLDPYCPVPRRQWSILWEYSNRRQRWMLFFLKKWVSGERDCGFEAFKEEIAAFPRRVFNYHRFARWNDVIVGFEQLMSHYQLAIRSKIKGALPYKIAWEFCKY
jgi:hypothetical protein